MRERRSLQFLLAAPILLALAAPSAAGATQTAPDENKCAPLGCTGDGSFFNMCDCKDNVPDSPLEVKFTGKYAEYFDKPEWEVTNTTDKDIYWFNAAVYYYDESGKQLEVEIHGRKHTAWRSQRSDPLEPGGKKTLQLGFKRDSEPQGYDSMQIVLDGWCYGTHEDENGHLCIRLERAPDDRPKS